MTEKKEVRQERIEVKLERLARLYDAAFDGIFSDLINIEALKLDLHFADNRRYLIDADRKIHAQRRVLKEIMKVYPHYEEIKVLNDRLYEVHKAIFKIMQEEYHIVQCWENENGELDYLKSC